MIHPMRLYNYFDPNRPREYYILPEDVGHMQLRKSGCQSFDNCRYRFALSFLIGIQGDESDAMVIGTAFHNSMEKVYNDLTPEKLTKMTAEDIVSHHKKRLPYGFNSILDMLFDNMIEMDVEWFEDCASPEYWPPITVEQSLDDTDPDVNFTGTSDRLDYTPDGKYCIISDYKTGIYHKYMDSKYRFELMGYKHLIEVHKINPKPIKYGRIIFPKEKGVFQFEFKNQTVAAFYRKLAKVRSESSTGLFPKNVGILCGWCPFIQECLLGEYDSLIKKYGYRVIAAYPNTEVK